MTMTGKSFSFEEAKSVCQKFQYLKGQMMAAGSSSPELIEAVAIAPYDEAAKQTFLQHYRQAGCARRALQFYSSRFYDVVVVLRSLSLHSNAPRLQELRSFIASTRAEFNIVRFG